METIRDDLAAIRRQVEPSVSRAELIPLRTVFHVHSKYSHDSDGSISDIVSAAKKNGISVIFLTDHTNPEIFTHCPEGEIDGVMLIRGEEISFEGSILALDTVQSITRGDKTRQQVIDEIKSQGGIAGIGHLDESNPFTVEGYQFVGIHNLHSDAKKIPWIMFPKIWLDAVFYRKSYSDEILLHDLVRKSNEELKEWDNLLETRKVTGVGEVDAHQNLKVLGVHIDPYKKIMSIMHTFLLVPPVWERKDLHEAIEKGRAFVGFSIIADPSGFNFELCSPNGNTFIMGDEVEFKEGLDFRVQLPAPAKILLIKDGETIAETRGRELNYRCEEAGVYRVEARVKLDGDELPWILSNPIYVR